MQSQAALIEDLRQLDARLGDLRGLLDNHARGRRYADVAKVARLIATAGEAAARQQADLDQLQTQAAKQG